MSKEPFYGRPIPNPDSRLGRERIHSVDPTLSHLRAISAPDYRKDPTNIRARDDLPSESGIGGLGDTVLELTRGMHIEEPHHLKIDPRVRALDQARYAAAPIEDDAEGLYDWGQTHEEED